MEPKFEKGRSWSVDELIESYEASVARRMERLAYTAPELIPQPLVDSISRHRALITYLKQLRDLGGGD